MEVFMIALDNPHRGEISTVSSGQRLNQIASSAHLRAKMEQESYQSDLLSGLSRDNSVIVMLSAFDFQTFLFFSNSRPFEIGIAKLGGVSWEFFSSALLLRPSTYISFSGMYGHDCLLRPRVISPMLLYLRLSP
jgi:hypothetical protein